MRWRCLASRLAASRRAWQTAGGSDRRPRQGIACHRPLAGGGASPRPQAASSLSGSVFGNERGAVEVPGIPTRRESACLASSREAR